MKKISVMVLGGGGREHALAWKLGLSEIVDRVFIAPGNPGTAEIGINLKIDPTDVSGLLWAINFHQIDLVVIGPELPLVKGVADELRKNGIKVFGPGVDGARLEGSKVWAKQFMQRHGIPTAEFEQFHTLEPALDHLDKLRDGSYVIKVDGLAAGKGVFIPSDRTEAQQTLKNLFGLNIPGGKVLIENRLAGKEISVFAITNGKQYSNLLAACDYKRAFEGDKGPNTGGMGCYAPPPEWDSKLSEVVENTVFKPLLKGFNSDGIDYRGVIYAGLMITEQGPEVLEFNARFGDPECQTLMPLLEDDFAEDCLAVACGEPLDDALKPISDGKYSVGISIVSKNYPESSEMGFQIEGIDTAAEWAKVFHAGTKYKLVRHQTKRKTTVISESDPSEFTNPSVVKPNEKENIARVKKEAKRLIKLMMKRGISFNFPLEYSIIQAMLGENSDDFVDLTLDDIVDGSLANKVIRLDATKIGSSTASSGSENYLEQYGRKLISEQLSYPKLSPKNIRSVKLGFKKDEKTTNTRTKSEKGKQMAPAQITPHKTERTDDSEKWVLTAGGRVLTVVGVDFSLESARDQAYTAIERIQFDYARYRKDIALNI